MLGVLFLAACNQDGLPPAARYATLQGTVRDATTGAPIAGALVIVDGVLTVVTDDRGTFTIPQIPPGEVDYVVQARGHAVSEGSVQAEPGGDATIQVALSPDNKRN